MPFNLMALGAGLGQFAQDYQRQQEAARQRAMLELTLQEFRMKQQQFQQQMKRQQDEEMIAGIGTGGLGGEGMTPAQPLPTSSGMGPPRLSPSALMGPVGGQTALQPRQDYGSAGEYGVGQGYSPATDISPAERAAWVNARSQGSPLSAEEWVGRQRSGAAGTLPPRGGADWTNTPGGIRSDLFPGVIGPQQASATNTLRQEITGGQTTPQQAAGIAGNLAGGLGGGPTQMAQAQIKEPVPPPDLKTIAMELRRDSPRASDIAIYKAANDELARRNEAYKQQYQMWHSQQQLAGEAASRAETGRHNVVGETQRERQITQEGQELFVDQDNNAHYLPKGSQVPQGWKKWSASTMTPHTKSIQVKDDAGNTRFKGIATQVGIGQWVDASGKPIDTEGMNVTQLSSAMGMMSQTANQRIIYGANEVQRAIENMVHVPMGTTLGWFGGAQAQTAEGLKDGFMKGLANEITPRSAQMLVAMSRGVDRGLAQLAGAGVATGLQALSESMKGEIPQRGDDGFTILTKYANMRQIVEAANETLQASDIVGDKQKELLGKITDRVIESVPWTVADVIKLSNDPSAETVRDFAVKLKVPGAASAKEGAATSTAKPPPPVGTIRGNRKYIGGDAGDEKNWELVR